MNITDLAILGNTFLVGWLLILKIDRMLTRNTPEPTVVCECDCGDDTDSECEMFAIRVFRFMDGSSCYILDDDDEYVVVFPDKVVRMREYVGSLLCRSTDSMQELLVLYNDQDNKDAFVSLTHFHDKFELQKFEEFLDESFEKTDSDSEDTDSVY